MKKFLSFLVVLTIGSGSAFAWGLGDKDDCPYSKGKQNQDKNEQVEQKEK